MEHNVRFVGLGHLTPEALAQRAREAMPEEAREDIKFGIIAFSPKTGVVFTELPTLSTRDLAWVRYALMDLIDKEMSRDDEEPEDSGPDPIA
jgi:hypothetical protein